MLLLVYRSIFDETKYGLAELQCPSRVMFDDMPGVPYRDQLRLPVVKVPRPSSGIVTMLENIRQNSLPFLQEAGIEEGSKKHKELKVSYISSLLKLSRLPMCWQTTIQALHRQYLHPFKKLEEQAPSCVDQLIAKVRTHISDRLQTDY